jgi:hypothetical protein
MSYLELQLFRRKLLGFKIWNDNSNKKIKISRDIKRYDERTWLLTGQVRKEGLQITLDNVIH